MNNFKELYAAAKSELDSISDVGATDFRLEQAEFDKKDKMWELIVSYLVENKKRTELNFNILDENKDPFQRIYKRVKINDKSEVMGFYIYEKRQLEK